MFSSAEKTSRNTTVVQQKAQQQTFFRKAGEEAFFGNNEQASFFNAPVQAKLSVSSPDDPQEKEADALAEQVMLMAEPAPVNYGSEEQPGRKDEEQINPEIEASVTGKINSKEDRDEIQAKQITPVYRVPGKSFDYNATGESSAQNMASGYINRKSPGLYHSDVIQRSGRGPPASSIPFVQSLTASKGGGSALPATTRKFMENRFQANFGGVRIHTGSKARRMNRQINAQAFTHGNDIYFNDGKHNPDTPDGAKLLAHELTHTIQQGASPQTVKNNTRATNPALPPSQTVKDNNALLPETTLPGKTELPQGVQQAIPGQGDAPLKDDLQKNNQPADGNQAVSVAGTPVGAAKAPAAGADLQAKKSSPAQRDNQTGSAEKPGGNEPAQKMGNSMETAHESGQVSGSRAMIFNNQISNAEDSVIKPHAVNQANIINQDYFITETKLNLTALTRKQEIRNLFSTARAGIDSFFTGNLEAFGATIQAAQATITSQVMATLAGVQSFINTMSAMALSLVTTAIGFVSTLVAATLGSIAGTIANIAAQVTNLANAFSLPNLPGVATVREFITSAINSVSGLIINAISSVQTLVLSALAVSLQFLTGLIQTIAGVISTILSTIESVLNAIINAIATGFQSLINTVNLTLRNLLNGTIYPMLANIEMMILATVDKFYQKALKDAEETREQALEALAAIVSPPSSAPPAAGTGNKPMTAAEMISTIELIGRYALERNQEIVARFDADVSFLIGLLRRQSVVFVALIMAAIIGGIIRATTKLVTLINSITAYVTTLAARIIAVFVSFVSRVMASISLFMASVLRFIVDPINALTSYVNRVRNIITSFVSNVVDRFIRALFNINSQQAPALQPYTAPQAPAFNPAFDPGSIIEELVTAIVEAIAAVLIAVVVGIAACIGYLLQFIIPAILAGIAVLLLLIFMLRTLGRFKPIPWPRPKPNPDPLMTHETKFYAPDGSPETRLKVGVGEEVEFTGNTLGDWAATAGTPLQLMTNNKFTWTAPGRVNTVTVTFTVGIKSVSEIMEVIEPSHYTAIKLTENSYPAGSQGAGMTLDFSFHPKTVSFGNVEQKEVSGPATNITGYYLVQGMPHHHNSGDSFFAISEDNQLESAEDHATQNDYPHPWDAGTFDWKIPNHFKLKSEAGDGKLYHEATQSFRMVDATGRTIISKEGASVDRTP